MAKIWPGGGRPLRQIQLQFIRHLERGDVTAEQALRELKITETVFGQWLQKPVFQKRYQRALQQVQARASSAEATAQLRRARKKLEDEPAAAASDSSSPAMNDSPMSQRLLELHGSAAAVEKKSREIPGDQ